MKIKIAEQILLLRKKKKLTQKQCAIHLGCTTVNYGYCEKNNTFRTKQIEALAEYLDYEIIFKEKIC